MSRGDGKLDHERDLEALWAGEFGTTYSARNAAAGGGREPYWSDLLAKHAPRSVLEVGCNVGANLRWITPARGVQRTVGIDINEASLVALRANVPNALPVRASARELPFPDRQFDLVFTAGVLIHQSPEALPIVMREIVRCARSQVLCMEYYAAELTTVPYRGHDRALFKSDFGGMYRQLFPRLQLEEHGFLSKDEGWDDITFWLFRTGS